MSNTQRSSHDRPNILIIMSDEQRWDSLGANGNAAARTPHLDALAASGTSFDRAYAAYPLCCPSRMSIWTGLMPHNHSGYGNWRLLREDLRDQGLIHPFVDAGYHTIYNGKWHVPGTTPSRFGFADIDAIPAVLDGHDRGRYIDAYRHYVTGLGYDLVQGHIENVTHRDLEQLNRPGTAHYGTAEISLEHYLEPWQTNLFLGALDRRPHDRPFLAVCSFNAPHFPMLVPEPLDTLIDPDDVGLPGNFCAGLEGKPAEVTESHYREDYPEPEWRRLIAHYLGLCALIDDQVGHVLNWLDKNNLRDNTIVVFTSDHGDMLGSHGLNKKGYPLHYEEAVRVPMILSGSEIPSAQRATALVSLMDLIPSLADLCDVPIPVPNDGQSFAGALSGSEGRDVVLTESFAFHGTESGSGDALTPADFQADRDGLNVSIRDGRHLYIFRSRDADELYDLASDPHSLMNIVRHPDYQPVIQHLRERIAASLQDSFPQVARSIRDQRRPSATPVVAP